MTMKIKPNPHGDKFSGTPDEISFVSRPPPGSSNEPPLKLFCDGNGRWTLATRDGERDTTYDVMAEAETFREMRPDGRGMREANGRAGKFKLLREVMRKLRELVELT